MGTSRHSSLIKAAQISASLVLALFAVKGVEIMLHISLAGFGVVPRTESGLIGIVFSPLLHANAAHLIANAVPLFVLLVILFWDRYYHPGRTLALIWLASGFGTWLIGRGDRVHIGASSLIFGLVSYLIVAGFLMDSWRSVGVALLVFFLFGGIFFGVIPQPGPISWEGHLSGAIAGVWAARRTHA